MTDEILERANENRRKYENCEYLLQVVTESADDDIRISCRTGSFDLPPQLNGHFIEMMTNYLNDEMTALNKEYKEL